MSIFDKSFKKNASFYSGRVYSDRRWIIPFFASLIIWISLFMAAIFGLYSISYGRDSLQFDVISFARTEDSSGYFVESDLKESFDNYNVSKTEAPRLAYLISGSTSDSLRMMRTLQAVYHPRNQQSHNDAECPHKHNGTVDQSRIANVPLPVN